MSFRCSAKLEQLCEVSNDLAAGVYGPGFDAISSRPSLLRQIDLAVVEIGGRRVPVLHNGSTRHAERAVRPVTIDWPSLKTGLRQADQFLIVPETATLLADAGLHLPLMTTALRSVDAQLNGPAFNLLVGLKVIGAYSPGPLLRMFDSHLSPLAYAGIAKAALAALGVNVPFDDIRLSFRPHAHDLAQHFCDLRAPSAVFEDTHFVREIAPTGNRGLRRWYVNPRPIIDRSILLIGDSHSYGGFCQLLSHVFRDVRFIWQSRYFGYGDSRDGVAAEAATADLMIEEISERFFLANHCRPVDEPAA
jgi:hypothetical protein